ncbi:LamG-like jellyroll fold domain-containing protein, partial [Nanoarchaeota archaeon]
MKNKEVTEKTNKAKIRYVLVFIAIAALLVFAVSSINVYGGDFRITEAPTQSQPILNSTYGTNYSHENLTVYNVSTSDSEGDPVINAIAWYRNGTLLYNYSKYLAGPELYSRLYMPFDDSAVNNESFAKDYSSFETNGAVINAVWNSASGYDDRGAYYFDGGSYIEVFGVSTSAVNSTFTVSLWFKAEDVNDYRCLFAKGHNIVDYVILELDPSGHIAFQVDDDVDKKTASGSNIFDQDNQWHHAVLIRNSSGYYAFVDTNLEASSSNNGDISNIGNITIGIRSQLNYNFSGYIDDVRIYDDVLSMKEIETLYGDTANYANKPRIILSDETNRFEIWQACIIPYDNATAGQTNCSNNITIVNYVPVHSKPILNSTYGTNYSSEDLTVYNQSTSDLDGDVIINKVEWYIDGAVNTGLENSTTIGSGNLSVGDIWYACVSPNDGDDYGATNCSNNLTIVNTNPNLNDIFINSSSGTNTSSENITCWVNATDIDNQNLTAYWFWFNSTAQYSNGSTFIDSNYLNTFINISTITSDKILKTETWNCTVFVGDGVVNETDNLSTQMTILNSIPTHTRPILNSSLGTNKTNETLTVYNQSTLDGDGDTIYNKVEWYIDGVVNTTFENLTTITSENTSVDDIWYACITPNDGTISGATNCSNNLTILALANTPPTHSRPILNSTYGTNRSFEDLTIYNRSTADFEGDSVYNQIAWFNNTVLLYNYSKEVIKPSLFSNLYMNFDVNNSAGTGKTRDYSPFGNNGTVVNATWSSTLGYGSTGTYDFDGNTSYIQISQHSSINNLGDMTVMAWVYWRGEGDNSFGNGDPFVSKQSGTSGWFLREGTSVSNSLEIFKYCNNSNNNLRYMSDGNSFPARQWNHIAGVFYNSTGSAKLYVNGEEVSPYYQTANCSGDRTDDSNNKLHLGRTINTYFNGSIDTVKIYNRSLSAEEIKASYINSSTVIQSQYTVIGDTWQACITPNDGYENGAANCSNNITIVQNSLPIQTLPILNATEYTLNRTNANLTVYYNVTDSDGDDAIPIISWYKDGSPLTILNLPFQGNNGSESNLAKDYSGNSFNGTVHNATWNRIGGYDGRGAYEFDGVDDYIELGDYDSETITVSVWAKTSSSGTGAIVGKYGSGTDYSYELVVYEPTPETRSVRAVVRLSNENVTTLNYNFEYNDSQWHHYAMTFTGDFLRIYIDGIQVNGHSTDNKTLKNIPNKIMIGREERNNRYWNGSIDNVMIFNHSLSDNQIKALYNNRTDLIVSQETTKGELWRACITPNDGVEDGASNCSNNLTVLNTPAEYTYTNIIPDPAYTNDTLFVNVTPTDIDIGDTLTVWVDWFVNGILKFWEMLTGIISGDTVTFNLSSSNFSKGDNVTAQITVGDDEENVTAQNTSQLTISNLLPTHSQPILNASDNPLNKTAANLTVYNQSTYDGDGDPVTNRIGWYINGIVNTTFENLTTINSGNTTISQIWYACITPNDGAAYGETLCSNNVTILNTIPVHSQPILNSTYGTNQSKENLTAYNQSTFDADSDSIKNIISWYRNSTPFALLNIPFEGDSNGSFTKDYSGNGYNGTVNSATWGRIGGYDGKGSYEFDGVNDYIEFGDYDSETVTVSAWVKTSINHTGGIVAKYGVDENYSYELRTNSNPRSIVASAQNTTGGLVNLGYAFEYNDSTWHHYAMSFNSTHVLLYVDGDLKANQSLTGTLKNIPNSIMIGRQERNDWYFNGSIDNVMIFNYSLSADQIKALYDNRTDLIVSQELTKGDVWSACVTPNDGFGDGSINCSNNLSVLNSVPEPRNVILNSTDLNNYANGTLNGYFVYYDEESETQNANETKWYVDGVVNTTFDNLTRINSGNTTKGQSWVFSVRVNDGNNWGSWVNSSALNINNNPPIHSQPILNSTDGTNFTSANLTVYNQSTNDTLDDDSIINIINWYKDGTALTILNMPFEGGSNSTYTKDYSDYNNDGTVINATWNSSGGHDGKGAYEFDGNLTNINLGNDASINFGNNKNFSISVWIKRNDFGRRQSIIDKSQLYSGARGYVLEIDYQNLAGFSYFDGSAPSPILNSSHVLNDENWHHLAVTWDAGNNSNRKLYVDGILSGQSTVETNSGEDNSGPLLIGKSNAVAATYTFNGSIDDVIIYNYYLTEEQVKALSDNRTDLIVSQETAKDEIWYACITPNDGFGDGAVNCSNNVTILNSPPDQSRPILNSTDGTNATTVNLTVYNQSTFDADGDNTTKVINWYKDGNSITFLNMPFEGGSNGTFTKDYSSNQYNGGVSGAIWNFAGGHDGYGSYQLDGINDFIGGFDTGFFPEITISVWIKLNELGKNQYLIGTDRIGAYLRINLGNAVNYIYSNGTDQVGCTSTDLISDTGWHHIAMSVGTTTNFTFYIDGVPSSGYAFCNQPNLTGGFRGDDWINTIGRNSNTGTGYFNGSVDDLRGYDSILSDEQVKALYDGNVDIIVSQETTKGEIWKACITPNDGYIDGAVNCSNNITILNSPPTILKPVLNSTYGNNQSNENLTVYNKSSFDADGDNTTNILNWYRNGTSLTILNMPFEGSSNSTYTNDYSGFGNNGAVTTAVWGSSSGHDGKGAYLFDGNDKIDISYMGINGSMERTLSIWVKTVSENNSAFIDTGSSITPGGTFSLVQENDSLFVRVWNGNREWNVSGLNDGNWHHIAVVSNGSSTTDLYAFMDGTRLEIISNISMVINTVISNYSIGYRNSFNDYYFNGTLDDIMIFNRSLSVEQINVLYNNRTDLIVSQEIAKGEIWYACISPNDGTVVGNANCSNNLTVLNSPAVHSQPILNSSDGSNLTSANLTVYNQSTGDADSDDVKNIIDWRKEGSSIALLNMPFEGGSNTTYTKDYSGYDFDGIVANALWDSTGGYDGKGAYTFTPPGDYIDLGFHSELKPYNEITVMAWIYPTNLTAGRQQDVVADFATTAPSRNYMLWVNGVTPFFSISNGTAVDFGSGAGYSFENDTWYHFVASFDGSDMRIYVDDRIEAPIPTVAVDNVTMSFWVNWKGGTGSNQMILFNGNPSVSGYGFRLDSTEGNQYEGFIADVVFVETSETLTVDKWTHIAMTRDSGTWRIYEDGQIVTIISGATATPTTPTGDLDIGANEVSSAFFNGSIDDVMIFNRSLSAEQIKALYNNRTDLIVSQETTTNEVWQACITPNDGEVDGTTNCSNTITILEGNLPAKPNLTVNLNRDNVSVDLNWSNSSGAD